MTQSSHSTPCLVFGCGNPLFGDDGFGPEVIEHLQEHHEIPEHVLCLDAGTGIRDALFDILLSEEKPRQIIIIDAAEHDGKLPGDIFEIDVDNIDPKKTSDFSLHQFPTTNMLKELKDLTNVDVRVLVVQIAHIPEEINPGLSGPVMAAVPNMCQRVMRIINKETA
ncbi:MAG: hydrogenase maturation protease [Desulfobacteraceae bacterium]|nr:MAG: hydrogenase maturation protease [Desulfobacteraceae bacterium]